MSRGGRATAESIFKQAPSDTKGRKKTQSKYDSVKGKITVSRENKRFCLAVARAATSNDEFSTAISMLLGAKKDSDEKEISSGEHQRNGRTRAYHFTMSAETRGLLEEYQRCSAIFECALDEVYNLMDRDSHKRFIARPEIAAMLL